MAEKDFTWYGSVSHDTMQDRDLIPRFLEVLADLNPDRATYLREKYPDVLTAIRVDRWYQGSQASSELLESLFDALSEEAPDGHYFGGHPGDGADYGFWQFEEGD